MIARSSIKLSRIIQWEKLATPIKTHSKNGVIDHVQQLKKELGPIISSTIGIEYTENFSSEKTITQRAIETLTIHPGPICGTKYIVEIKSLRDIQKYYPGVFDKSKSLRDSSSEITCLLSIQPKNKGFLFYSVDSHRNTK